MVFVVNQDFSFTIEGFTVETKENVKVEVGIPYGEVSEALRVGWRMTSDGDTNGTEGNYRNR